MQKDDLETRYRFFITFSSIVLGASLILFYVFDNIIERCAIVGIGLLLVWLGFRLAMFSGISENRVRLTIVAASSSILFFALQLQQTFGWLYKPLLAALFAKAGINLPASILQPENSFDYFSAFTIAAWVIIAFFVLRRPRDQSAMGPPKAPLADILPDVTNHHKLSILKTTLRNRLDNLDYATRWNDSNYVPLEAEVQIIEGKVSQRKIIDLLRALRIHPKTRLFVILGEPGTGKSIALRKLSRDLLSESGAADRIPIYINLKEWKTEYDWEPNNRPTVKQFHEFIYHNLLQTLDFSSQSFLNPENYQSLLQAGFFFFILDSFDEIPAVLDHDENSWLIAELSNCISTYILSGLASRGVISSRLFRQPKLSNTERSVLEIRPFSDDRIMDAIRRTSSEPERLIRAVLTERHDLGSVARNPFLLHLIIIHFNLTRDIPTSQAEMFQTFIDLNITQAKDAFGLNGISENDIFQICEDISAAMFEKSRAGLEIGEPELRNEVDFPQLPYVLQFLAQARLGRVAPISGAFSFSHRRFNEYFLVRRLQSKRTALPFEAIQTDSRWRDALVLYAEIANDGDARALAEHAWNYAARLETTSLGKQRQDFLEARRALRFIIEGFRNRPAIIAPYRADLGRIIQVKLASGADYIEKKTVVEAIGLLPIGNATKLILWVLKHHPGWISEQAASAARYLNRIGFALAYRLYIHCIQRPGIQGLEEARRQSRILTISDAFASVSKMLRWYQIDVYKSFAILIFLYSFVMYLQDSTLNKLAGLSATVTANLILMSFIGFPFESPILKRFMNLTQSAKKSKKSQITYDTFTRIASDFTAFPKLHAVVALFLPLLATLVERFLEITRPSEEHIQKVFEINQLSTTTALYFVFGCALIIFPMRPTFWRTFIFRLKRLSLRSLARELAAIVGPISLLAAMLLSPQWLQTLLFGGLTGIAGLLLVIESIRKMIATGSDLATLNHLKHSFIPDRAVIASNFSRMKTAWGRMRYVRILEKESVNSLDNFRRESNVWPDGRRPQYDGDEASIRLAQLDARWLDLD